MDPVIIFMAVVVGLAAWTVGSMYGYGEALNHGKQWKDGEQGRLEEYGRRQIQAYIDHAAANATTEVSQWNCQHCGQVQFVVDRLPAGYKVDRKLQKMSVLKQEG